MATSQTNPFDQFDAPNPFDQFDHKEQTSTPAEQPSAMRLLMHTILSQPGIDALVKSGSIGLKPLMGAAADLLSGGSEHAKQEAENAVDYHSQDPVTVAAGRGLGSLASTVADAAVAGIRSIPHSGQVNQPDNTRVRIQHQGLYDSLPEGAQDIVRNTGRVASDVAMLAPVAKPVAAALEYGIPKAGAIAAAPVNYFRPSVQVQRLLQKKAGTAEQRALQADQLLQTPDLDLVAHDVPNSGMTVAQSVRNLPEGTALQAIQRDVAQVPEKGISGEFSRRFAQQQQAVDAAKQEAYAAASPFKERAFAAVRANGGVDAQNVLDSINGVLSNPKTAGSPVANTIIKKAQRFITSITDANGKIDPEKLTTFRSEGLGELIANATSKEDQNIITWQKTNTGKGIEAAIDSAIVKAGGEEWPQYLKEYSTRRAHADELQNSLDEMYQNHQQTAIGSNANLTAHGIGAPHLFNRETSMINYGLGLNNRLMQPRIDRMLADLLQNPRAMAEALTRDIDPETMAALRAKRMAVDSSGIDAMRTPGNVWERQFKGKEPLALPSPQTHTYANPNAAFNGADLGLSPDVFKAQLTDPRTAPLRSTGMLSASEPTWTPPAKSPEPPANIALADMLAGDLKIAPDPSYFVDNGRRTPDWIPNKQQRDHLMQVLAYRKKMGQLPPNVEQLADMLLMPKK